MQLARRIGLTPARLARRAAPALALRSASRVLAMMSLPLVATAAVFLVAAPTAALPRTVRVGPSASADAPTISGGLRLVPPHQTARWTLVVEPGVYRERVWVNSSMGPLTLKGTSSPEHTLLVFHCCPAGDGTKGCSNATADPACIPQHVGAGMTRGVETLLVEAADFVLSNLAVANDACQYDNRKAGQSEALQLLADRTLVTNSQLLGAQDTLYSGGQSVRQYIVDTYINGSVDSIYGESTMVIERCEIAITDHVTAAKSGPNDIYLISQSRLVKPVPGQANYPAATGKTELGRAWGAAAHIIPPEQVVFKDCFMDSHISRYGWGSSMNGCPPSDRSCKAIRFAEFNSTGPGADAQARAKWSRQLTPAQAAALTPTAVLRGWAPSVEVF